MYDLIDDYLLNQIITEEMPIHYKKFTVFYALGLSVQLIAEITKYQPITVNKALYKIKDILILNRITDIKIIVLNRILISLLTKGTNKK